ncbi:GNAT family N-acetyltransferase [Fonticella tunisiensis]|uniref:Diamine N-acetyltransferase n=1 Tax=Fonticella tunisiensis TaxID=1096341 RepID=A0A4R7KPG8_9CLOT|nr:GNAT family protein [Fonticella tunisiensis]TDT61011.1 diamine N-acetyltransferase [Fonticella tunisiensis]
MLCGKKVFLRAVELEDARIISAWLNDRKCTEHLDIIYPISKRYADSFVLEADEDRYKKVFIIDSPEHRPIGLFIIDKIRWEYRNCEIGIAIYDKNQRGKGYGRDAVETALDFIFNSMNMHLVYLHVEEDNGPAINLYKSLGFEVEGLLKDRTFKEGKYKNVYVMSKTKGGMNI